MERFADEEVRHLAVMCSAQSAKTTTIMALMAWAIAEDPGPILWVTSNLKEAVKFARSRLIPFLERVGPVAARFPQGRGQKNLLEIYFPGAPLVITGANSPASLQSTPFRYLFLDEVRSYPPGALEMVMKRTRAFSHSYKCVVISTPDEESDPMHRAYLDGDQRLWHVKCLSCGHEQALLWGEKADRGGFKFDSNLKTATEDYDHHAIAATIRFRCESCGHDHEDAPSVRKAFCSESGGRWRATCPTAPRTHASWHYNAQLPHWNPWHRDVEEWLKAMRALRLGDPMPLKSWVNETSGRPWTSDLQFDTADRYIHDREADYDRSAPWADEARRIMTVDVQGQGGRHYFMVVRAWASGARSRLLHAEKVWTIDELRRIQTAYAVPDRDVGVDIANWTAELTQNMIVPFGWRGLRGDEKKEFFNAQGIRRIWDSTLLDPAIGTKLQGRVAPIQQFLWSKPSIQHIHALLTHGQSGDWRIYKDCETEYKKQVTAWSQRPKANPRGGVTYEWWKPGQRADHYSSCEHMQIAIAAIVSDGSPAPILGDRATLPLFAPPPT